MVVTVQIAIWGTTLAVVVGIPFAILASANICPQWIVQPVRRLMDACRAINEIVFALMFVVAVGLGPFAGVMALRPQSRRVRQAVLRGGEAAVEAIDPRPVEGIRATGARRLQEVIFGVIPQVLPLWSSLTLYRLETNVRSATTLGIVGAGGIGQTLYESIRSFQYGETAAQVIVVVVTVVAIDLLSARIRKSPGLTFGERLSAAGSGGGELRWRRIGTSRMLREIYETCSSGFLRKSALQRARPRDWRRSFRLDQLRRQNASSEALAARIESDFAAKAADSKFADHRGVRDGKFYRPVTSATRSRSDRRAANAHAATPADATSSTTKRYVRPAGVARPPAGCAPRRSRSRPRAGTNRTRPCAMASSHSSQQRLRGRRDERPHRLVDHAAHDLEHAATPRGSNWLAGAVHGLDCSSLTAAAAGSTRQGPADRHSRLSARSGRDVELTSIAFVGAACTL